MACLAWLLGVLVARANPQLRWAQNNTTLYLELKPPKGVSCEVSSEIFFDRVVVSCADAGPWELELREDVWSEESRSERTGGTLRLMLRKRLQHRWDRPFQTESSFSLPRDWKREDANLPDEDEVELPRAKNIQKIHGLTELKSIVQHKTVVAAMRYPWCTDCEERDKAFVKVGKVVGAKAAFQNVTFCSLNLREAKDTARMLWDHDLHKCKSSQCPLLVFKPDEPLEEPYQLQVHLLYEVDEAAMMSDPMAGMPGHVTKGQTAKPDYERFERELSLLLPPAMKLLLDEAEVEHSASATFPLVLGTFVNATRFRWAARNLRGVATFALVEHGEASIKLWKWDEGLGRPLRTSYNEAAELNASHLEHFARVHSQPVLQNYSWAVKGHLDAIGMPLGVLWVNYSEGGTTDRALAAFRNLCTKRRGTNASRHILCCVMDESQAYHQREYGSHEPYPFPFFGITRKLGFAGDRFGYPFKEPVNSFVAEFFSSKRATSSMDRFVGKVLRGRIAPSHESNVVPNTTWRRGEVEEVVWKTYQKEINGSTADILLELYDDQRKNHHVLSATMDILARTLKDYADMKVARMEVSQNYVPWIFGRKQYSKETEYYWIPPSLARGMLTPTDPKRYSGEVNSVTPGKLLRFLKHHTLSSWSLKEALESADDIAEEVMGRARMQQQAEDRAEEDKQQMIKKMMTTLKKEKGLVDMNEVMGLRQAATALGTSPKGPSKESKAVPEEKRRKRREDLQRQEKRQKEIARRDKEKKRKRKEAEEQRKKKKKVEEEKRRAEAVKLAKEKRRQREAERLRQVARPLFSWGQSKEHIRISVAIPKLQKSSANVSMMDDRVTVRAADWQSRRYLLDFELRELVHPPNCSWSFQENPREGLLLTLQKAFAHRWDRLAQNHSFVKSFLRKDWVQDDADEMDEDQEDVELPSGPFIKRASATALQRLLVKHSLVVVAPRFPWCDKCREKDREFVRAAKGSREQDHLDSVAFAVIDAREDKNFTKRYNVSCDDICELLLFKEDEPDEPYVVPGRRFSEEIQVDCYKHLLPVVSYINNQTHFERVRTAFDTAIIGFFHGDRKSDPWLRRFQQVARQLRGHALFGAVFGRPREMGIDIEHRWRGHGDGENLEVMRPQVLLFKSKEQRFVEFTGDLTLDKLSHFSKVLSVPLLSQYTPESRQKYIELKVPLGMLWLDGEDENRSENQEAREVTRRLALRFSGHLVFVLLNTTRDGFLLRPFGLDPRTAPHFGIASSEAPDAERFAFRASRAWWRGSTFAALEEFCEAFLNGTLEAAHESAELPASYTWPGTGVVEEVVWKTFRSSLEVDNVLLELYSPYRPQHRTHLVVLDVVAEALVNVTTLKVARMDTVNNYIPPEIGLKDKEKEKSSIFFRGTAKWRRFAAKSGPLEELPKQLLRFVHREMKGGFDLPERLDWVNSEALRRIRRLKALEKDYEKKMQDEWMQKELEEFERYKRLGKFDNLNV